MSSVGEEASAGTGPSSPANGAIGVDHPPLRAVRRPPPAQVHVNGDLGDYGYLWWATEIDSDAAFLAFGHPGTFVAVMPESDVVVVIVAEIDDRDPETWDVAIDGTAAVEILSIAIAPHFR